MSVLVVSQTLWPFVNTLTRYAKYSLGNKEILLIIDGERGAYISL